MKYIFSLVLILTIQSNGWSQSTILLTTGQKVKGTILDTLDNGDINMKLKDNQKVKIPFAMINSTADLANSNYLIFPRYKFIVELGRYNHDYSGYGYRFNLIQGVDFSPYVFGGLNLGYRTEQNTINGYSGISFAPELRFNLSKGSIRPFLGLGGGILYYFNGAEFVGMLNLSFGSTVNINEKLDLNTSIGFESDTYTHYYYFNVGAALKL